MGKGQVWIETVIYTLIALTLIASVLAIATPKIQELQDRALLEQSLNMLDLTNTKVLEVVQGGAGNKRELQIELKKGKVIFDGTNNKIYFNMESRSSFSQVDEETGEGEEIKYGSTLIKTEGRGREKLVTITLDYGDKYDVKIESLDQEKVIERAAVPYTIIISNSGYQDDKSIVNVEIK